MNHVEIAGKSYPVQFGYGALMEYEVQTGKSAMDMLSGGVPSITDTITLIACGLKNGAEAAGNPIEYTAKQVVSLIDATPNSPAVIQSIMEILGQSFAVADTKKKTVTMAHNRETRRRTG